MLFNTAKNQLATQLQKTIENRSKWQKCCTLPTQTVISDIDSTAHYSYF